MPEQQDYYTRNSVQNSALLNPQLSDGAKITWILLQPILNRSKEEGYLVKDEKPMSLATIASQLWKPVNLLEKEIAELLKFGILEECEGVIFDPWMISDKERKNSDFEGQLSPNGDGSRSQAVDNQRSDTKPTITDKKKTKKKTKTFSESSSIPSASSRADAGAARYSANTSGGSSELSPNGSNSSEQNNSSPAEQERINAEHAEQMKREEAERAESERVASEAREKREALLDQAAEKLKDMPFFEPCNFSAVCEWVISTCKISPYERQAVMKRAEEKRYIINKGSGSYHGVNAELPSWLS